MGWGVDFVIYLMDLARMAIKGTQMNERGAVCDHLSILERIFTSCNWRKSGRHVYQDIFINVISSQRKPAWSLRNKGGKRDRTLFLPTALVLAHEQGSRNILGSWQRWRRLTFFPSSIFTSPSPISITIMIFTNPDQKTDNTGKAKEVLKGQQAFWG